MEREISIVQNTRRGIPTILRVATYVRVSSPKEAMLDSLSNQVSYYSAMIQRRPGWQFAGIYVDEGVTGTKDARPEFQRLITDCKDGKIDMVITKSTTRFARNTVTMLSTVRMLREIGVDVFFEKENIHSTSGDGELMLTILSSFAQEESRSVSENCKWRLKEQMKQGKLVGLRRMYGYEVHRDGVSIHSEQATTVRRIFRAYIEGKSSISIARQLATENVPTLNGGTWSSKYVRDILTNEKYVGDALLQKTYVSDHFTKRKKRNRGELPKFYSAGSHDAIIDRETFERAQALLAERGECNKPKTPTSARYPFTGKIVCGFCGRHYQRKKVRGKPCWLCATYLVHGKAACPTKQIPEDALLQAVAEALGLEVFSEQEPIERIDRIEVPEQYRLRFVFTDGQISECAWKHHSRSESWTDEMKQRAREKDRERRNTDTCQR